jgi:alpha-L-fucosidase
LIDCASKGGNYLLNVGPTGEGRIPEASVQRLTEIGQWMQANHEAIYETSASPFKELPFEGRCTAKGNKLFLHVFTWPAEGLKLVGLNNKVRRARVLDGRERLQVQVDPASPRTITLSKPAKLDPIATVVEVTLSGQPVLAAAIP